MKYRVKSFAKGRSFLIVDETGLEVYDDVPYRKDKPVVFYDKDEAIRCAEKLTKNSKDSDIDSF